MKTRSHWIEAIEILLAIAGLLALLALPARADSFNCTNIVNSAVSIVSWPTNTAGTNGLPQSTGGAISVKNQEWAGFFFEGYSTTANASTVVVTLVRGFGDQPGLSTFDSTGTNINGMQWESISAMTLSIPVAGATGPVGWFTNLDRSFLGGCNWVGIYSITNSNRGATGALTNVVMGLNKKIIPIRYP